MTRTIKVKDKVIEYDFHQKNVKNINIRIKSNGSIYVSANKYVPIENIENFILSKGDFIINAIDKFEKLSHNTKKQYYDECEIKDLIESLCYDVYPYFEKKGIKFPEVRFRKMISQWGNCRKDKGILTFNTNLMFAPFECVKYVVLHEFVHLIHPNHSRDFYNELEKVCPEWKIWRKKLREIQLKDN